VLRAPELDAGLQVGSHQSGEERQNPLSCPSGRTAKNAAQGTSDLLVVSVNCWLISSFSRPFEEPECIQVHGTG